MIYVIVKFCCGFANKVAAVIIFTGQSFTCYWGFGIFIHQFIHLNVKTESNSRSKGGAGWRIYNNKTKLSQENITVDLCYSFPTSRAKTANQI